MNAKNSDRQERLAAALRENLKRRKARARTLARTVNPESTRSDTQRQNKAKKPD
jgi:hypothetical protein